MSQDFQKLSADELDSAVAGLESWEIKDKKLRKEFEFGNFVAAFGFISQVALRAQQINHHPDWSNSYNKVTIELFTHSTGEVTNKDIELAQAIDEVSVLLS